MKGVPFYGESGEVIGVRGTDLRPGGAFEKMGLQRGDVVLRCGDDEVTTMLALFRHADTTAALHVRREVDGRTEQLRLCGS